MNHAEFTVKKLVDMIEGGELRLPELQRRYVWRATRVRDLFDSLYRGYPSGNILMWETGEGRPVREMAVKQSANPFSGHKLLLDGQQRLTSLSAVLRGVPVRVKGRKKPISLLFNLEHPDDLEESTEVEDDEESQAFEPDDDEGEENDDSEVSMAERLKKFTFVVEAKALAQQRNWVSVSKIFASNHDADLLRSAGVSSMDDPRFGKYSERLQRVRKIRDYSYTVQLLPTSFSYEAVADVFVRVNSLGVKLRGSDLALAQITAKGQNCLELLEQFQEECEKHWMTLDLGLLVRAMIVFATGQSRFRTVSSISLEQLQEGWERAKDGLRFAVNFLKANAHIEDESMLSSPLFFITIAYYAHIHSGNLKKGEDRSLLFWLYIANARGRYSRGSTETLLDADLATIAKAGSPEDLTAAVKQQFGRVHLETVDLVGRGANSPLMSLVFLALRANGAKDWNSGVEISLVHQGRLHFIQVHHIFPRALIKHEYEKREVNEIANFAFISAKANLRIGAHPPADYLPKIIAERGEESLRAQCVPIDPELHKLENYRAFLETRRHLLVDRVNQFIGAVGASIAAAGAPERPTL